MAGSVEDLVIYRYNCAAEELDISKELLGLGRYKQSISCSYYSIFHAIRSVNALDNFDSKKHSGVIAHFNQFHVKNGEFPKEVSHIIKSAFELRSDADYEDFYVAARNDAAGQIANAEVVITYVAEFLKKKGIKTSKPGDPE